MKIDNMKITELTSEEEKLIDGGDEALYGVGYYIGRIGKWFCSVSYPSESYSNAMSTRGI